MSRRPLTAAAIGILLVAPQAMAQRRSEPPALGIRIGTSGETRTGRLTAVDVTASVGLPWRLGRPDSWLVDTKVEGSLGTLTAAGKTGVVGSAGPTVAIRRGGIPLYVDGGTAAAFTSERQFGRKNLGTYLQFISHISFLVQLGPVNAGYRLQHMSNASLSEHNPGVNQHMLELRYTFR